MRRPNSNEKKSWDENEFCIEDKQEFAKNRSTSKESAVRFGLAHNMASVFMNLRNTRRTLTDNFVPHPYTHDILFLHQRKNFGVVLWMFAVELCNRIWIVIVGYLYQLFLSAVVNRYYYTNRLKREHTKIICRLNDNLSFWHFRFCLFEASFLLKLCCICYTYIVCDWWAKYSGWVCACVCVCVCIWRMLHPMYHLFRIGLHDFYFRSNPFRCKWKHTSSNSFEFFPFDGHFYHVILAREFISTRKHLDNSNDCCKVSKAWQWINAIFSIFTSCIQETIIGNECFFFASFISSVFGTFLFYGTQDVRSFHHFPLE